MFKEGVGPTPLHPPRVLAVPDQPRVLVVDDEPGVRDVVSRSLARKGFLCAAASETQAALLAIADPFDLVVLDINLPKHGGIWLLKKLKEQSPDTAIVMLTGTNEVETAVECLRIGADDYLTKPVNLGELEIAARRAIEKARLVRDNREYQRNLERMVRTRTAKLSRALRALRETYQATLESLVAALDAREEDTGFHSQRVMRLTVALGRRMGVPTRELRGIARGALLHDIGKIGVMDRILLKPGKLTDDEWREMRQHPEIGYRILQGVEFLSDAREIVLSHQERWDGRGYPRCLKGEEIPFGARIFAIMDAFDAMASTRPYKKPLPFSFIREEINRCAGTQFDPRVVDAFLSVPEQEWLRIRRATDRQC